jgi:hypothetical protein
MRLLCEIETNCLSIRFISITIDMGPGDVKPAVPLREADGGLSCKIGLVKAVFLIYYFKD